MEQIILACVFMMAIKWSRGSRQCHSDQLACHPSLPATAADAESSHHVTVHLITPSLNYSRSLSSHCTIISLYLTLYLKLYNAVVSMSGHPVSNQKSKLLASPHNYWPDQVPWSDWYLCNTNLQLSQYSYLSYVWGDCWVIFPWNQVSQFRPARVMYWRPMLYILIQWTQDSWLVVMLHIKS